MCVCLRLCPSVRTLLIFVNLVFLINKIKICQTFSKNFFLSSALASMALPRAQGCILCNFSVVGLHFFPELPKFFLSSRLTLLGLGLRLLLELLWVWFYFFLKIRRLPRSLGCFLHKFWVAGLLFFRVLLSKSAFFGPSTLRVDLLLWIRTERLPRAHACLLCTFSVVGLLFYRDLPSK